MPWPFKDYDYYGDRYVNMKDPNAILGETMWYERDINRETVPTECILCIEAENEMYTKYAHPKAHSEAHTQASHNAESLARKEKDTEEYLNYYIFYYGREYSKVYKELYKIFKEEYSKQVLEKKYNKTDKICQHHLESIQYHSEVCERYD
jgi:hypothetical protein